MHMKNLHAQAYVIPTIHKEKKKCTIVLLPYPSGHWYYILKWNIFGSLVGFEVCKYAQDKIVSPTICVVENFLAMLVAYKLFLFLGKNGDIKNWICAYFIVEVHY